MIGKRAISRQLRVIRNPDCTRCCLHKSSTNVCIMGRGKTPCNIMLIGEAPGIAEETFGQPFMGPAGVLLNGYLKELNMADKVYITNVCKCRPPENRKPTADEVDTCSSLYLFQEIKVIQPWVVVLLGITATSVFFGKERFIRGKFYPHPLGFCMVPTYHPAHYLHSGANSSPLFDVLRAVKEVASKQLIAIPKVAM